MNTIHSIASLIFGLCIGSFLNVVIYRLPLDKSIVNPGSACPNCGYRLRWYDNIPVLSYIFLLGRCRQCRERISLRYPFVELMTGALSLALFVKYDLSWAYAAYFIFAAALVAVIFIDFDYQIIPDVITYPGTIIGLAASFFATPVNYKESLMGMLLGGGILYLIATGYFLITKREGMGGGDIKLLAMIGSFLGWKSIPLTIFSSAFLGAIVGIIAMVKTGEDSKLAIPFGPFLSIGAFLYLFAGPEIIRLYFRMLS